MSPEKLETIRSALKLQGDLKMQFLKMRLGEQVADLLATEIMDQVLKSDVVKPEIKAIYEEIGREAEQ